MRLPNFEQMRRQLGLSMQGGPKGRGKCIRLGQASRQSATSALYGPLYELGSNDTAGPDAVTVQVPKDGLIFVLYTAQWLESVDGAARAAIFLNGNQAKTQNFNVASPPVQEASVGGNANILTHLHTHGGGLAGSAGTAATAVAADDLATGMIHGTGAVNVPGGPCVIEVEPGTYTVSIQYKCSSGFVAAQQRRLKVWTMGFD